MVLEPFERTKLLQWKAICKNEIAQPPYLQNTSEVQNSDLAEGGGPLSPLVAPLSVTTGQVFIIVVIIG